MKAKFPFLIQIIGTVGTVLKYAAYLERYFSFEVVSDTESLQIEAAL